MTVAELIVKLKEFPQDSVVSINYRDNASPRFEADYVEGDIERFDLLPDAGYLEIYVG